MVFRVVLDACVLLPYPLRDLLLRLAESGLFQPLWSADLLDEVERNLVSKLGLTPARAGHRVEQMRTAFPLAEVDDYHELIPALRNHPKDRHVLAAAVRGHADLIVTANLKDFPADTLAPYGLDAVDPDEFLLDQLDLDEATTIQCVKQQRSDYNDPAMTRGEFYSAVRKTVPHFANAAEQLEHSTMQ